MNYAEPSSELDALARSVIGAAFTVHSHLGPGHYESIYERALILELEHGRLNVERQVEVPIYYRDAHIGCSYIDVLVEKQLVVELKAVDALLGIHRAQLISYLQAANLRLGLLLNFNVTRLRDGIKRVVWTRNPDEHPIGPNRWR